jgi:hypothetical protein
VKEGTYFYHFVVDGQVRFAPDQASVNKGEKIVNFIEIDSYMIGKAEEDRERQKVKSVIDCIAYENSWKVSQNFEKNCIERMRSN